MINNEAYINPKTEIYKHFSGRNAIGLPVSGNLLIDVYPRADQSDLELGDSGNELTPVILVHGGGWNVGSTFTPIFRSWLTLLKNKKLRVFSIEHRLSACTVGFDKLTAAENNCWPYPSPLEDVRDAIIYVKKNAKRFGINPERVILVGDSAGGHLSMLHALKESKKPSSTQSCTENPFAALCDSRVIGVANFYAPVDFEDIRKNLPDSMNIIAKLFNETKENLESVIERAQTGGVMSWADATLYANYQDADVIRHVHPGMPPVFLSYSPADTLVPYSNLNNILSKISSLGISVALTRNDLSSNGFNALFTATIDTPAVYFPHAYMLALGALGKSFYFEENALAWDNIDPPKDLKQMLGLGKKKKQNEALSHLLDALSHDASQYADAKEQLHQIDRSLRNWISNL